MRTAARTAIATAVLAGALLAPAGAAFAAAPQSAPNPSVSQDGKTQGSECVSNPIQKEMGRGLEARLTMTPDGPRAELISPVTDAPWRTLTRTNPALPSGEDEIRILNASSAKPVLEWHLENGAPYGHAGFPELPANCKFNYPLQKPTEKPKPETPVSHEPSTTPSVKPSAKPTATPAAPKGQTAGQTSVVPKGSVAAGAETGTEDTGASTAAVAGTGLAAGLAALGGFVLFRRRAGAQR